MPFRPAQSTGTVCSGRAQPGTKNLLVAVNDLFDWTTSLGIYNCRPSSGGGGLSTHAEGRGVDIGIPGVSNPLGYVVLNKLRDKAWDLGIQRIIWDRKAYSAAHPNGSVYTGPSPHNEHLHVEQTWEAAKINPLTLEAAYNLLGDDDVALTPEQEATLNELVAVRAELKALSPSSNFSAITAAVKLIRAWRKLDDIFDTTEI